MIAEVPTAREELKNDALLKVSSNTIIDDSVQAMVTQLENMSKDEALDHVRQAATKACQVIKWKP